MRESEKNITRVTLDEARRMKGKTDYARLDAMTDDDIARAVESDPTMAPIGSIDWDKASLVIPAAAKDVITLRLDHDVLEWLRSTGKGYQTRINQVLRAWYEVASKRDKAAEAQQTREREEILTAEIAAEQRAEKTAARRKARKAAAKLKVNVEPGAKKREAPWKKFHAAGPGFRAHGSYGFAGAKKSAAKRSAKKTARRR
jgi:uncharacterized protein (DUF4415 family)